ncbi:ATP-binding cassette domain-containing protein, partial [Rhizobium sp.]|uniref:ATP-binding cassette domain-containing protein n=1 Tax=Rhizobium sp. TaxID=391 RepID=UPI002F15AC14
MTTVLHRSLADAPAANTQAILEMRGISQIFPGVKALDGVSISLYPGKVTALIGENGAGKSTLVKILTGIYRPNEGEILIDGKPTTFANAQAAIDAGVTAIHQETVLFDELTVAENIFLGHAPRTSWRTIDWKTMNSRSRELLESLESAI